MANEELEKSLRDEIDRYVGSRLSGLQDEIANLQSQINETFTRIVERFASETQTNNSLTLAIADHIRAARELGIEQAAAESARSKRGSAMALLKAAVDEIDNQRWHHETDVLATLVNRAAAFAPRVAFFVIKNESAIGWRARGLEGTVGDDAVREIRIPLDAGTLLTDVVRNRATWSGAPDPNSEDKLLYERFGEPPSRIVAIPLVARGKTVAVLYADSAALDADAINLEAIETLARVAGMAVEFLHVTRHAPAARPAQADARPPEAQTAPPGPDRVAARDRFVTTELPRGIENIAAPRPAAEPPAAPAHSAGLGAHARPVAAQTPEEELHHTPAAGAEAARPSPAGPPPAATAAEPPVSDQFSAPLGAGRRWSRGDAELPVEVSEADRRLHNDARRFARLLVSEIKLYNEQKLKEGRSQGDIYDRLREDIDRSRQMYDKRVAPPVAARYDYFHQELINTLAEGDPSKLGSSYPGAAVSA